MTIVVIGAGIVGVSVASYLLRDGHAVVMIDRQDPGEGTSKGNAGAVSPGSCVPLAMPGILGKVPGYLFDQDGPLAIRPSYALKALPWLLRFVRAARPQEVERIADALIALHGRTLDDYAPLLANARAEDLLRRTGTLVLYKDRAAFEASRGDWDMRRRRGVAFDVLDAHEIRQAEPTVSDRYGCGVLLPTHGHVVDPHAVVTALARQFAADGGKIERREIGAIEIGDGGSLVRFADGGGMTADRVVVAAGAWSSRLLSPLGLRAPLETQRGYHLHLPAPGIQPRMPVTDSAAKVYATPMAGGLRIAGTVEFAGLDAEPNWRRARNLLDVGRRIFGTLDDREASEWMGHRPCLPDSLPAVGAWPGVPSVLAAFGHGHNGMTSGPVTGRLIADMIAERRPVFDPTPLRPDRFAFA